MKAGIHEKKRKFHFQFHHFILTWSEKQKVSPKTTPFFEAMFLWTGQDAEIIYIYIATETQHLLYYDMQYMLFVASFISMENDALCCQMV